MAYQISYTIDNKLLHCVIHGKRTKKDSLRMWKSISNHCSAQSIDFVLVEFYLTGRLLPNENLSITNKVIKLFQPFKLKLAVVDHQSESFHDNYLGSVIANQDHLIVKVFDSVKTAYAWLNQN